MNDNTNNGPAAADMGAVPQRGAARPLRVAALLSAASPVTAAVFAFAAPVVAAVPVTTVPAQASDVVIVADDHCQTTGQPTALDSLKWPLCAGD